jgi:hypothetical protein
MQAFATRLDFAPAHGISPPSKAKPLSFFGTPRLGN